MNKDTARTVTLLKKTAVWATRLALVLSAAATLIEMWPPGDR